MAFDYEAATGRALWKMGKGVGPKHLTVAARQAYEYMCQLRLAVPESRSTNYDPRSTEQMFIDDVVRAWPLASEENAISLVKSFFHPAAYRHWLAVTDRQLEGGLRQFTPD